MVDEINKFRVNKTPPQLNKWSHYGLMDDNCYKVTVTLVNSISAFSFIVSLRNNHIKPSKLKLRENVRQAQCEENP